MPLSQLFSNLLHHVCSTVNSAIAWNSPSPKVAGVAFFTAAQALAFYIFATVDEFNFPMTMHYLSLRLRFAARFPFLFIGINRHLENFEEALFNALLRTELAVDDRIRGARDRSPRHITIHEIATCPCSGYPRLGILSCYPLLVRLIKPTLSLGYGVYRCIASIIVNDDNMTEHVRGLQSCMRLDFGNIVAPRLPWGGVVRFQPLLRLMWTRRAGGERLFIRISNFLRS
ncbi:hypothetical protein QBC45DRAFT_113441 [Copromyces sp. CBS 386.78]|nr:hypothetical protein QBC45DRAFT_113441 [Copromyces sp. CBS 386.78]